VIVGSPLAPPSAIIVTPGTNASNSASDEAGSRTIV
jgi:hypothetical protein